MGISGQTLNGKLDTQLDTQDHTQLSDLGWETQAQFTLKRQTRQAGAAQQTRLVIHCQDTGESRILDDIFADAQLEAIAHWLAFSEDFEILSPSLETPEGAVTTKDVEPAAAEAAPEEAEEAMAKPPRPVSVQIRQVRLSQALRAAVPLVFNAEHTQRSGAVIGQVPFTVQVGFSLSQSGAIASDLRGQAQVFAMNRSTGDLLNLGDFGDLPLTPVRGGYLTTVSGVRFDEPGIYHLKLLLRLHDCPTIPGYFEIPLLQAI
ncbi:MAG: hypothetical protein VKK04_00565 [Synechococcales bacterium]|nr:hypothetical protein [Synechococcales bacterium]